jgi:NAD(P)H dehydrogenase (quinone)
VDTNSTLAVTGSTGSIGGAVAGQLARAGVAQRLLVREATRAPRLAGATVLACSYSDREASVRALTGVHTLFMVSASESADRRDQHRAFVESARSAGVRHIVYTSFVGAAPDATFTLARDHHATEEHVRGTGMEFTFLRDNMYLDFLEQLAGEDGVIRGPAGHGRVAAVARADVARTAAAVLQEPTRHRSQTYQLTGPEAVTLAEVAELVSRVRGAIVSYHDETEAEAYASRQKWGAPDWQVDAWVSTYLAIASGELAHVSGDVERVTGRPPLSLAQLLSS